MSLSYKLTYKSRVYLAESPVCKIPRKYVHTAFILLGTALACWIYWKASAKVNINPIIWDLITNVSLQPFPTPCKSHTFLVIIVSSYSGHVDHRMAHRTFMPKEELRKINATRVFLLAQLPEKEKNINQSAINDENLTFGDILQGNFIENYRNMTYRHLMGLKWASTTCQGASFILKVDDDTVYNLNKTYAKLNSINDTVDLLMGYLHLYKSTAKIYRNKEDKWYVSWDEYPRQEYTIYLSGWYYITTPRVAAALCDEAIHHPFFWKDDVFVTGILREALGIGLTYLYGNLIQFAPARSPEDYLLDNFKNCYCCSEGFVGRKEFDCRNIEIQ